MYYFGASVINEVADNFFVVPADTISWGWKAKAFSIVLEVPSLSLGPGRRPLIPTLARAVSPLRRESRTVAQASVAHLPFPTFTRRAPGRSQVFQLGALFPAAAFDHGDCLRYMDPLGVDLKLVRTTIVAFGYACWSSLVVIGLLSLMGLAVHVAIHMCLLGSTTMCSGSLQRYWNAFISPCTTLHERIFRAGEEEPCSPCCKIFTLYLAIASVPMYAPQGSNPRSYRVRVTALIVWLSPAGYQVHRRLGPRIPRHRRAELQGRATAGPRSGSAAARRALQAAGDPLLRHPSRPLAAMAQAAEGG